MPASDVRFQRPDGMVCGLVGIRMTAAIEMIAAVMPVAARILTLAADPAFPVKDIDIAGATTAPTATKLCERVRFVVS